MQDLTQWLGPRKAIMSPKQRPTRCLLTEYTQEEWRYLWLLVIKYGTCCPWSQHIMTSSQNLQSHKFSYTLNKYKALVLTLSSFYTKCKSIAGNSSTSPPPLEYFSGFTLSLLVTFFTPGWVKRGTLAVASYQWIVTRLKLGKSCLPNGTSIKSKASLIVHKVTI